MSQQTKSLLCYMDFATHTGFASVAHNLLDRLLPFFQDKDVVVNICATNYIGQPFWYEGKNGGKAYVRSAKDYAKNMNDLWYRDGMLKLLNEKNWDIFWAINDIPVFSPMMQVLNTIRSQYKYTKKQTRFKAILYTPIDSPVNQKFMNDLDFWDSLVTYTQYGKKQIEPHVYNSFTDSYKHIDIIPHGANKSDFYPIKDFDIKEGRKKWKLPEEGFMFGNINKNNSRKNIGGTLLAFRNFLDWYQKNEKLNHTLPQPYLYLHCSPTDETGIDCYRACESLGIRKYVFFPEKEEYKKGAGYTTEEMNEVYNCLNCYVTTTGAEGWGLTITEAMAVGLPIVAPLHTSIKEICENGAACYPVSDLSEQILTHDYENVRFLADPVNTAWAMTQAYNDVIVGKFPHKNAYTDILAEYDWDKIAEMWKQVFLKHL